MAITIGKVSVLLARQVLLEAAADAKARGDIGKPEGPEAWEWLQGWADRKYPLEES